MDCAPEGLLIIFAHELVNKNTENFSESFIEAFEALEAKGKLHFSEPDLNYPDHN